MRAAIAVIGLSALSSAAGAQAVESKDRLAPNFPISVANPTPSDALRNGPLFKLIDQLSSTASEAGFANILASDVKFHLHPKSIDLTTQDTIRDFLRVLLKDCQGPYSIDEALSWVQTSWVCHIGEGRPIRKYFSFQDSPEISLDFKFADGKIQKVFAMDLLPLPMPGKSKYLPMNAAETISDKR